MLLSEETTKAIKDIKNIIKRFPDHGVIDVFKLYSAKDIVLSAVALSRLQRITIDFNDNEQNALTISNSTLHDLAHYAVFANAAYGWKGGLALSGRLHLGDMKTLMARTGIEKDQIIYASWRSKTHRPAFFLVRENLRKKIILTIRGTLSTRDVLTDLCCTAEDFYSSDNESKEVAKAHNGMFKAAKKVSEQVLPIIMSQLHQNPGYELIIVGHSLGAGTAAVLGTMWISQIPGIKVYAYGSPCVGPIDYPPTLNESIISVIGSGDPFATLSLGHIADTSKAISILCESTDLRKDILSRTKNNITHDDKAWCHQIMGRLRKKMTAEKFYPPGKLVYMSGSTFGDEEVKIHDINRELFSDLILSPLMFNLSQHVPNRYESALARYWKDTCDAS